MRKNLYILMEIASRELDANLILALFSLRQNFNVYIGDSSTYRYLLKKSLLSPGVVLTKSVTHGDAKSELHNLFKSSGFILTSIDHEHGVLDDLDFKEYFIKSRIAKKELEKFDAFFCWGSFDYKNLREFFPDLKKKFFLTGSNRVDAWRNIETKKTLDNKNKKIAIFTNFAFSNNKYGEKKLFSLKERAGYYIRCPKMKVQDKLFLIYQKKLINKFVKLINFLSEKYPKYIFFIKPHPTENNDFWNKKLKMRNNIEIINSENSTSLIKNSNLVIQTRCTTSVEASINSVNHINFIPIQSSHGYGKFVDKISINTKKNLEVAKQIDCILKLKNKNMPRIHKLNNRILFKNKEPASKKISLVLNELFKKVNNPKNKSLLKIKFFLIFFEVLNNMKSVIYNFIFYKKNINEYKFPSMKENLLKHKISRYSKIYKIKNNYKISKLGKRLWLFENF